MTRRPPANPWSVAVIAYAAGTAVILGLGFVLGLAGLFIAFGMGISGAGDSLTRDGVMAVVVTVGVGLAVLGIGVQARVISSRRGTNPVAAPVAALIATLVVGLAVSPLALPSLLLLVLHAVIEIGVMGLMIQPGR